MKPEITELYKISEKEMESVYEMMRVSFQNYPKLAASFPDWDDRQAAIEMTIRFFGAFDYTYGYAYSLDDGLNEVAMIMYSEEESFSDERCAEAGCESEGFRRAAARFSEDDIKRWHAFFDEVDRTEEELQLPEPYLYVDFVCVREGVQGQGRGSRLIQTVCRYADKIGRPVMLFTNGEEDIRFYKKNGFRIIGVTRSEEFGFENTYMWYDPAPRGQEADHEC